MWLWVFHRQWLAGAESGLPLSLFAASVALSTASPGSSLRFSLLCDCGSSSVRPPLAFPHIGLTLSFPAGAMHYMGCFSWE